MTWLTLTRRTLKRGSTCGASLARLIASLARLILSRHPPPQRLAPRLNHSIPGSSVSTRKRCRKRKERKERKGKNIGEKEKKEKIKKYWEMRRVIRCSTLAHTLPRMFADTVCTVTLAHKLPHTLLMR
jgi:hypothetical protein